MMKHFHFCFITCFILNLSVSARKSQTLNYDISCAGNAIGYYIVEVSAYSAKKRDINENFVKKCALHGVLFKGFSGESGCVAQKPIISGVTNENHSELIDSLLHNEYNKYTECIGGPLEVIKQNKRYKITTTIQVAKDQLRKYLENKGIIRKLGF